MTTVFNSMLALDGGTGFRNKIINGCGWIDQRNANNPIVVNNTSNNFGPDRWAAFGQGTDGVFTFQGTRSFFDPASKGMPSSIFAQTTTQTDRFTFQGTGLTNWQGWAAAGTWAANAEL